MTLLPVNHIVIGNIRRPLVAPVAAVLLSALLFGCADNKQAVKWEVDKPAVEQGLVNLGQRLESAEKESADRDEADKAKLLALAEQNAQLQELISALEGRVRALEAVARARKKVATREQVYAKAESKPSQPVKPVSVSVPEESAPAVAAVDPAVLAEAEKNAYTAAYLALKSGRFDEAMAGFNKLLDKFPQGEYADQAWYWLGESHLALSDGEKAMLAFKYVADHYTDSVKHAPALMKLAQIADMQKDSAKARVYYSRLISEHPETSLAEQARSMLSQMSGVEASGK